MNRPGKDYNSIELPSADPALCRKACDDDVRCRAYTYVNPGVQGPSARCWLKSEVPPGVPDECCVSGVKADPGQAAAREPVARGPLPAGAPEPAGGGALQAQEAGVNRPGRDYNSIELPSADPALCRKACDDDARCRAYTYVNPGVQGPSARCWLKSEVPPGVPDECCVSGVKADLGQAVVRGPAARRPLPPGAPGSGPVKKVPVGSGQSTGEAKISGIPDAFLLDTRMGFEIGFNRPGEDYRDFAMPDPNPELCKTACQDDGQCSAFTFVRGGLSPAPPAHCWLKKSAPKPVRDIQCVSGVIHRTGTISKASPIPGETRLWPAKEPMGPQSPEAAENARRMNVALQSWRTAARQYVAEANAKLRKTQEEAFRASLDQVKTFMGNEAQVLAVAASPELRASLVNRRDLPPFETPGTGTLATPPVLGQVLSVSSQKAPGDVDEGGCLLITGSGFGKKPGRVRLTFRAIKEFAPQQDIAVDLLPLIETWTESWTDTLIAARVPYFRIAEGYLLSNDPAPRLEVSFGPGVNARTDVPVTLSQRGIGLEALIAFPAWADNEHVNAVTAGGKVLVQGAEFGTNPEAWIDLPYSGRQVKLQLVTGSDRQASFDVPGKGFQGDYPFEGGMFRIRNNRQQEAAWGVTFGPQMETLLVSGEQFLALSKGDAKDHATTEGAVMTVLHDPNCAPVVGNGNSGLDYFFDQAPYPLPRNSKVLKAWVGTHGDPDETYHTIKKLIDEAVDWCSKGFWYKFVQYGIVVIGALFDSSVGRYGIQVEKAATEAMPERFRVHWWNTCWYMSPQNGVPVVYFTSFAIRAPKGTITPAY